MSKFLAVALKEGSLHYYMELCPLEKDREDWSRLRLGIHGRYATCKRQEEASAMLRTLSVAPIEMKHSYERAALAALLDVVK